MVTKLTCSMQEWYVADAINDSLSVWLQVRPKVQDGV